MRHAKALVVLDTMWGDVGKAPRWFAINPANHSGRRLYKLLRLRFGEVWVTNACRERVGRANVHGVPDAQWLLTTLCSLTPEQQCLPLFVCGKVAQSTFAKLRKHYTHDGGVYYMMHPASRLWTKYLLKWHGTNIAKFMARKR